MELINIVIQYSRGHGVNTLNAHIWYGNILSLVASVMEVVYKRAALVLKRLQRKEGSLKSLVFSTKSNDVISFRKQIYAIVAETLKR